MLASWPGLDQGLMLSGPSGRTDFTSVRKLMEAEDETPNVTIISSIEDASKGDYISAYRATTDYL